MPELSVILELLKPHGLLLRGVLDAARIKQAPVIDNETDTRQLVLVGNAGSSIWSSFSSSPEYKDAAPHPLDRWSKRIGENIARQLEGRAIFPWEGPPYAPFLAWARKADQVFPSPVSMFVHGEYGLWHAYRFALALPRHYGGNVKTDDGDSPCLQCSDQPCLDTCPVAAFSANNYDVNQCFDYLASDAESDCRQLGCAARRACPVGRAFIYQPVHARFHMDAYVKSRF